MTAKICYLGNLGPNDRLDGGVGGHQVRQEETVDVQIMNELSLARFEVSRLQLAETDLGQQTDL